MLETFADRTNKSLSTFQLCRLREPRKFCQPIRANHYTNLAKSCNRFPIDGSRLFADVVCSLAKVVIKLENSVIQTVINKSWQAGSPFEILHKYNWTISPTNRAQFCNTQKLCLMYVNFRLFPSDVAFCQFYQEGSTMPAFLKAML